MTASQKLIQQPAKAAVAQRRNLSIHEYQSVQLLNSYGIPTPKALPAFSPSEAEEVAKSFGEL